MQRPPNVGSLELPGQSRRHLMARWLISASIVAATVSVNASAWGQSSPQNRGLGKVSPDYVTWYHSRVKTPIYLIDNQGRNAARILIHTWAPPGAPVTQHVIRGDDQFDKDVKLKVTVDNLTTNCKVAVNWLGFLFKEDGQPSSAGLDAPPGADPDTTVGPGQNYIHTFTFTEVKTFVKRGAPVLHEVKPDLTLQCPGSDRSSSRPSQASTDPTSGKSQASKATKGRNAGAAGQKMLQIMIGASTDRLSGVTHIESLAKGRLDGCTLTGTYEDQTNMGMARDINFDLGGLSAINYGRTEPGDGGVGFYEVTVFAPGQDDAAWFFGTDSARQAFFDALVQASKNCGATPEVHR